MSKFVRVLLIVLAVVLLLVLVGPFLIPIRPLPDTQPLAALTPPESEFVAVPFPGTGGIRTHVRTSGDSDPTFVLLHGFAANLYTWDLVFDEFAENGRVLAYDRIPYGLSARLLAGDWSGPNPYTPEASIDQLIALLDAQGIERAVLVGNSAGGALAMRAALAYPERVQGLILISAGGVHHQRQPRLHRPHRQHAPDGAPGAARRAPAADPGAGGKLLPRSRRPPARAGRKSGAFLPGGRLGQGAVGSNGRFRPRGPDAAPGRTDPARAGRHRRRRPHRADRGKRAPGRGAAQRVPGRAAGLRPRRPGRMPRRPDACD
jgi:pimeloyl-ACP methyl ester carboxylesterase